MSDFVQLPVDGGGKKVECDVVDGLFRQAVTSYQGVPITYDASGRARVSQLTTLFDGKTLNEDDAVLWDTAGTGATAFADNTMTLTVTPGQYVVRQSKHWFPYFSGKPQVVEPTFDGFAPVSGLVKRVGYFSSSTVAPYTANLDGWYLESNGDDNTIYLVVVKLGVEKLRIAWTDWDGYADITGYNWDHFTVTMVDFLWLGGAVLRLFLKSPDGGFPLCHTFDYAGSAAGTFMHSPNQPVRYEIRSTTGAGSLREICSQVSTEGSISENGQSKSVFNNALIAANTPGTIYALKGIKKLSTHRDTPVRVQAAGMAVSTSDSGIVLLLLNPTLSAPLSYATNGAISEGTATTQTVTATGYVIASIPVVAAGQSAALTENVLAWLGSKINGTLDEIVLAYLPLTVNQSVAGTLNLMRY